MTENPAPFFSVVMTVFNGQTYLAEAIESVLSQRFRDWELVVVDDASRDRTPEILAGFAATDTRIRVLTNEENRFSGYSSNRAIKNARGTWITCIDADDAYRPDYLQSLHPVAASLAGESAFVSSWPEIIDDEGQRMLDFKLPEAGFIARMMPYENFLYHVATSYPRKLWTEAGGYTEGRGASLDAELWRNYLRRGARLVMVPEVHVRYRIHHSNITLNESGAFGKRPADPDRMRRNKEWRISLYLKQTMAAEARCEIAELAALTGRLNLKNLFYRLLTHLPAGWVRCLMWEIRPRLRAVVRGLKLSGRSASAGIREKVTSK